MAEAQTEEQAAAFQRDVDVKIASPRVSPDLATIIGALSAIGLIIGAIALGRSNANFLNGPSFLIVICGTIAATSISYSSAEIKKAVAILGRTMMRHTRSPSVMATQLLDIAMLARKKGILALSGIESELRKDPYLARSVQLVTDGYSGDDIDRILGQEIDSLAERHRRSASILRRASEVAPAMGLIGTLVGLVQMLAQLDDPASIGPAMAVALLTTFYGAILGTVLLGPLAGKLERNSSDETMIKRLVVTALISIAQQENPRRLEIVLNSELPPDEQIRYFD
ncbi:MAG: MotA/TolQ/ExbB proton channel family protein [Rhodospirillales bacterium]|nr:MotA/TolQ/ExbB proton channel family protein [Rhodospirillales bacterium]